MIGWDGVHKIFRMRDDPKFFIHPKMGSELESGLHDETFVPKV